MNKDNSKGFLDTLVICKAAVSPILDQCIILSCGKELNLYNTMLTFNDPRPPKGRKPFKASG